MFISTYLFIKLFLEHWDGTDPGVFAIHSNEWKLRGKLWLFMCVGQMTLEKLTSVSATARPKYILLLYILFHFPSSNIALHCTALDYLSSVLNSILNGHKTHLDTFSKNARIVVKIFNCGNHMKVYILCYIYGQPLHSIFHYNLFPSLGNGTKIQHFQGHWGEEEHNVWDGLSKICGPWLCWSLWLWSVGSSLWAITQTSLPGQFHGADPRLGGENRWRTLKLDFSPHYLHFQIWHANKLRLILTISIGYAFKLQLRG